MLGLSSSAKIEKALSVTTDKECTAIVEALRRKFQTTLDDYPQYQDISDLCFDRLLEIAKNHRVLNHLDSFFKARIDGNRSQSAKYREALNLSVLEHQKGSLKKISLLFKILTIFENYQIPCLSLKGHALSHLLYNNAHLRMFSDIDLILPKQELMRACTLLSNNGFHSYTPISWNEDFFESIRYEKDIIFWSPDKSVLIEIHFKLLHEIGNLEWEELWNHRKTLNFDGRQVNTLSDKMNLIYLCAHGHHHGWERIDWIFDFANLIVRQPIDQADFLDLFAQYQLQEELGLALQLCNQFFGIKIHKQLLSETSKRSLSKMLKQTQVLQNLKTIKQPPTFIQKFYFQRRRSIKKNYDTLIQVKNSRFKPWILKSRPLRSYHLWLTLELFRYVFHTMKQRAAE